MSHTTQLGEGWTATHNGDFSGEVTFWESPDDDESAARIPFDVIKALVAQYVRSGRIEKLEEMEDDEVLG